MTGIIPWAEPTLWGNEERYAIDALRSTWISGGPYVDRFEQEFAAFCGAGDAIAVANGTSALHLAYLAAGIGPGDEVIVPGFAFMAAANMALMVGATPVFADVDRDSWCITADTVSKCVSDRTRAIIPVDTYGNVCAMEAIVALADSRGLLVIEDAAEAIGSARGGRMAGTLAPVGVFSFHATKTITTGEGGAVVTDDPDLAARMRLYRSHGMGKTRYWHEVAGHNFRLTNLQAALGCAQLEQVANIVARRAQVYSEYVASLQEMPGVVLQSIAPGVVPVMWAIAVRLDPAVYPQGRDTVIAQLAAAGIETRPGFYPASAMPHLYGHQELATSAELAASILVLPSSPSLCSHQVGRICAALAALAD